MTINQQLDGLFRDWNEALGTYDGYEPDKYTRDGLIYKYKPEWGFEKNTQHWLEQMRTCWWMVYGISLLLRLYFC